MTVPCGHSPVPGPDLDLDAGRARRPPPRRRHGRPTPAPARGSRLIFPSRRNFRSWPLISLTLASLSAWPDFAASSRAFFRSSLEHLIGERVIENRGDDPDRDLDLDRREVDRLGGRPPEQALRDLPEEDPLIVGQTPPASFRIDEARWSRRSRVAVRRTKPTGTSASASPRRIRPTPPPSAAGGVVPNWPPRSTTNLRTNCRHGVPVAADERTLRAPAGLGVAPRDRDPVQSLPAIRG